MEYPPPWTRRSRSNLLYQDIVVPKLAGQRLSGEIWQLQDGVVVGAVGLASFREAARWRKLVQSEGVDPTVVFLSRAVNAATLSTAAASFPPSEHTSTVLAVDPDQQWEKILQGAKSFGAVIRRGRAVTLVSGPPVESDWDRFRIVLL